MAEKSSTGVFAPIEFPCGVKVSNRLVKAPMYEHLADFLGGPPSGYHLALYSLWSRYNWGMVITGNVQVSKSHLTLGRDLIVPDRLHEEALKPYKALASTIRGPKGATLAIMQLSHAGRQSANFIGGRYPFERPLAPSAVGFGGGTTIDDSVAAMAQSVLFQTPKEMSLKDIDEVVGGFVRGAQLAHQTGFDGIELHVAHGYLLAQFLSPKSNTRGDQYSIHSENGLRLLHRVVDAIRATVPRNFIIGVKLNASDYINTPTGGGSQRSPHPEETRALKHVLELAKWRMVDFIDISGGDYENPDFMVSETTKSSKRQAFFARFSQQAIKSLNSAGFRAPSRPVIMLTGGLRTPNLLQSALESGQTDMLGIGRGAVVCAHIPDIMRQYEQGRTKEDGDTPFGADPDLSTPPLLEVWPFGPIWRSLSKVKLVGAGLATAWYTVMIRRLALADLRRQVGDMGWTALVLEKPDYAVGGLQALFQMYLWMPNLKRDTKQSTANVGLVFLMLVLLTAATAAIYYVY